jgi:acrylyl-CoA reductase (NADPH)
MNEAEHLKALGASELMDRAELSSPGKPLAKERWAAVVDSVGSHTLANACASTRYRGIVTACGLAQGMDFPSTVAPFILRGVTLKGIDSVMAPFDVRQSAWLALAKELPESALANMTREIPLGEAPALARELLEGKVRGRLIVDVNA